MKSKLGEKLKAKLLNSYDPPRRPIGRTLISVILMALVAIEVGASIFDIHLRDSFRTAPACPAWTLDDGCHGTETAHVGNVQAYHDKHGKLSGYRIYLEASPSDWDPQYDAVAVTGWFDIGKPPQAFMDAATTGHTVDAEIYNYSTVALSADGLTVHTGNWPSTLVQGDIDALVGAIVIIWLLLRSAGRALWWRTLGGRKRGWALHAMRLLDLSALAICVAGPFILNFYITPGVTTISIAGVLLVLTMFVPPTLARYVRVTRRAGPLPG